MNVKLTQAEKLALQAAWVSARDTNKLSKATVEDMYRMFRTLRAGLGSTPVPTPAPAPSPKPPVPPVPVPPAEPEWWDGHLITEALNNPVLQSGIHLSSPPNDWMKLAEGYQTHRVYRNCSMEGGHMGFLYNNGVSGPLLIENCSVLNPKEYGMWWQGRDSRILGCTFHGSIIQHPLRAGWAERCEFDVSLKATNKGGGWWMHGEQLLVKVDSEGTVGLGPNEHRSVSSPDDYLKSVYLSGKIKAIGTNYCVQISSGCEDITLRDLTLEQPNGYYVLIGQRKDPDPQNPNGPPLPPPRGLGRIRILPTARVRLPDGTTRPLLRSDLTIDPLFDDSRVQV